ncbi:MAG: SlyX family protein [Planctomycetes bacterium]|nr:SlyX family protein [Planctomycetota bacterium]
MSEALEQRLIEVESLVAHLERDLRVLSETVYRQQNELDRVRGALQRLEGGSAVDEDAAPADERPPHY